MENSLHLRLRPVERPVAPLLEQLNDPRFHTEGRLPPDFESSDSPANLPLSPLQLPPPAFGPLLCEPRPTPQTEANIEPMTTMGRGDVPAAVAAKGTQVHISGLKGKHCIQKGIAYFYRGHYLYSTNFNPVVPVIPSKKGIFIENHSIDTAPIYNRRDKNLKDEGKVRALHRSMVHEWDNMMSDNADFVQDAFAAGGAGVEPARLTKSEHGLQGDQGQRYAMHEVPWTPSTGFAPSNDAPGVDQYYNSRARFLAASAPGSGHATPLSPILEEYHSHRRAARGFNSVASFPQIACDEAGDFGEMRSSPAVPQTLRVGNATRSASGPSSRLAFGLHPSNASFASLDSGTNTSNLPDSHPASRPAPRPASRISSVGYIQNLNSFAGGHGPGPSSRVSSTSSMPNERLFPAPSTSRSPFPVPSTTSLSNTKNFPTLYQSSPVSRSLTRESFPRMQSVMTPSTSQPSFGIPSEEILSGDQGPNVQDEMATPRAQVAGLERGYPLNASYDNARHEPLCAQPVTGRPRKDSFAKASRALNEAYNINWPEVNCQLHGPGCDGVTVTEEHQTEQCRLREGFAGVYPLIHARGRTMVNWYMVYLEEVSKGQRA